MEKYFLNFSSRNDGSFSLETIEGRETVFDGNLDDISGGSGEDWQNALDVFFENQFGIRSDEWTIG